MDQNSISLYFAYARAHFGMSWSGTSPLTSYLRIIPSSGYIMFKHSSHEHPKDVSTAAAGRGKEHAELAMEECYGPGLKWCPLLLPMTHWQVALKTYLITK